MKGIATLTLMCLASIATAQAPRIRDSAGVKIIENGPRLTAPVVFQLGDKPTFDYGGLKDDPVDELSSRNGYPWAVRLSNGNVVILDVTRVLFFNPAGKRIAVFGRQGDGPQEFRQATDVCESADGTVLIAQGRKPLNKVTSSGAFIAAIPLPEAMQPERRFCFGDGSYVLMSRVSGGAGAPSVYRFARVDATGEKNRIVDHQYPPYDAAVRIYNEKAVFGNRMYFFNGDAYEIKAYDLDGKLVELIRTSDAPVLLTDDQKGGMMGVRAGATPAEIEESRRRALANSRTKYAPALRYMFVDLDGRIWVEDWQPKEDPTKPSTWAAFDASGRLLGRMLVPGVTKEERRFVVGFGKNEIWFNRMDADGAIHYTAYPIVPARR